MKVWPVMSGGSYEDALFHKIFATRELAEAWILENDDSYRYGTWEEEVVESLP